MNHMLYFILIVFAFLNCQPNVRQTETVQRVYEDGVYNGTVKDWPSMHVEVQVGQSKITSIKILESDGTETILDEVEKRLIPFIIEKGTYEVDGISGATLSSTNLKLAIKRALNGEK